MTASSRNVIIRCDGAAEIGFGHVVRCLALADELRDGHGCLVDFAMLRGPQCAAQVRAQGYVVHQPTVGAEDFHEGSWLREIITNNQHRALILDVRTDLPTADVHAVRESGVVIVTIDDPSERRLLADLAFYPPVPQVERLNWTGFTGYRFVGWDWVLLRPQFAETARKARQTKAESIAWASSKERPLTLMVTMGGSDPAGLTLMALEAIEQLDGDLHVVVVIGAGFMHKRVLEAWLSVANRVYDIRHDATDMASLMADADLAVISFGVTAYELAAIGVPSVYLCLTDDHADSASAFVDAGLGLSLGRFDTTSTVELTAAIARLLLNNANIPGNRQLETPPIDGLATLRVAKIIADRTIPLSEANAESP